MNSETVWDKKLSKGQVVLVTGGGSGIGRAAAVLFAREGASAVAVMDINEQGARETVDLVKRIGAKALLIKADVSQAAAVKSGMDAIVKQFGRLDSAFNDAGIEGPMGNTDECRETDWDHVVGVNLKGVWLCMKFELGQMLLQGGGCIVNAASVAGLIGFQRLPAYVASKHGVVGLTRAAAVEYARSGIRINAVSPGMIRTPMVTHVFQSQPQLEDLLKDGEPVGRLGTAEEVAEAVVWLCSPRASFVTGHALAVDGGWLAQGDHLMTPGARVERVLVSAR